MGWFDSLWSSSSTAQDPLRNLDPKLREFLEKESPVKYQQLQQQEAQQRQAAETAAAAAVEDSRRGSASGSDVAATSASVPSESLYQDGRYAHLWKTYRPLAAIEAETKTDHEKLMDVLEGFKERKAQIGKAALENCAVEQSEWRACMTSPSVTDALTMCRTHVKQFERCYNTQTRLLKALGYLSTMDRSPELEEKIQMHADKLYHRMLTQEAEIEAAKAEGRPIPTFAPLVPKQPLQQPQYSQPTTAAVVAPTKTAPPPTTADSSAADPDLLTPDQQETMKARLAKVAEEDRPAEEAAIRAELRLKAELASRVQGIWREQDEERAARKAKGESTLWDRVAGTFRASGGGGGGAGAAGQDAAGAGGEKK